MLFKKIATGFGIAVILPMLVYYNEIHFFISGFYIVGGDDHYKI